MMMVEGVGVVNQGLAVVKIFVVIAAVGQIATSVEPHTRPVRSKEACLESRLFRWRG